jgi:hypothetical protein
MPGPALSATFTYDGTPGQPSNSDPFNTLDREVIQSNRFFQPIQIGTHSRIPLRSNIPRNSDEGKGAGEGGIVNLDTDNAEIQE